MKLRTAAAALASIACTALTAAVLAGPASAAMGAPQAVQQPSDNEPTLTNMVTVNGDGAPVSHVAFDQEGSVSFSFLVQETPIDGTAPGPVTGTVSVFEGDNKVCDDVDLDFPGMGSCAIPANLSVGDHTFFATYNGGSDQGSQSGSITLTVTKEPTSVTMQPFTELHFGQESAGTFKFTVSPRTSGTPSGKAHLNVGNVIGCTATLADATGTCSLPNTLLAPGTYAMSGSYEGDGTFEASNTPPPPQPLTLTIDPGQTSTTLSLSAPQISFSQQETEKLTVNVSPIGDGTPTGNVTIMAGATTICPAQPIANGTASCHLQVGALPVGSHPLTASYSGDTNFGAATDSATLTVTDKTLPTASLSLSAPRIAFGREHSEKLTAEVTGLQGIAPTGSVTIMAGSASVCTVTTLSSGQGTCQPKDTKLRPGTYHLTARYSGDDTYSAVTSATQTLTVTAEPTTSALTLSAATVKAGHEQAEHLTVTVKPTVTGTGIPAGKVTIKAGTTKICDIILNKAKGTCTLTARKLHPGTYHLTASYAGGTPFAASTSGRKTLTVKK